MSLENERATGNGQNGTRHMPTGHENTALMEHSYSRDWRPTTENGGAVAGGVSQQTASTRTIMVHKAPKCASCHSHSHDGGGEVDLDVSINQNLPAYNEEAAKLAMDESSKVAKGIRNSQTADEADWEDKINKYTWSVDQIRFFDKITRILDLDRLARQAHVGKLHEPIARRVIIDRSVERMRRAFGAVFWDAKLTQWVHNVLLDNLPPSYLAIYLDILQTMKAKVPSLTDRILFGRPGNVNQDLIGYILKKPWEPIVTYKNRKLNGSPVIVVVPSAPVVGQPGPRLQKWYSLFATMGTVVPVHMPVSGTMVKSQSVQTVAEQMVSLTRAKLQEIRQDSANRPIILVGLNAGAALAIQVGIVEPAVCIIAMGFAYHTVSGDRGTPDDHILDLRTPVMFVIGQNAAKSSSEDIETLREKMTCQTALVLVGSADDALRVGKTKRKIEGVTQTMVDNMIMDEIADFASNLLVDAPPMKSPDKRSHNAPLITVGSSGITGIYSPNGPPKKHRLSTDDGDAMSPKHARDSFKRPSHAEPKRPRGRPRLNPDRRNVKVPRKPYNKKKDRPLESGREPIYMQTAPPVSSAANSTASPVVCQVKEEPAPVPSVHQQQHQQQTPPPPQPRKVMGGNQVRIIESKIISASSLTKLEIKPASASKIVSGTGGQSIVLPTLQKSTSSAPTNIKVLSSNQFIQLKPSPAPPGQKIFTIKTSPKQNSPPKHPAASPFANLGGGGGNKQQFVELTTPSGIPTSGYGSFSPTKFTIVKASSSTTDTPSTLSADSTRSTPEVQIENMPIVFAEAGAEETIEHTETTTTTYITRPVTNTTTTTQYYIQTTKPSVSMDHYTTLPRTTQVTPAQLQLLNKNLVVVTSKPTVSGQRTMANRVVVINKNAVQPIKSVIQPKMQPTTIQMPQVRYAKLVMSSAGGGGQQSGEQQIMLVNQAPRQTIATSGIVPAPKTMTGRPVILNVTEDKSKSISSGGNTFSTGSTVFIRQNVSTAMQQKSKPTILSRNLTVKRLLPGTQLQQHHQQHQQQQHHLVMEEMDES